jgi:magnesium chelatase family protein
VRYFRRFSGPILDRFDLRVELTRPSTEELTGGVPGEPSACVAARVQKVRQVSLERQGCLNSAISADMLEAVAPLSNDAMTWLRTRLDAGRLSARGYHRVRRVARTLADINNEHEAISEQWVKMADRMRVDVFPELGVMS